MRTATPRPNVERVMLSEQEQARLTAVAVKLNLPKTEVMRRALDAYLKEQE